MAFHDHKMMPYTLSKARRTCGGGILSELWLKLGEDCDRGIMLGGILTGAICPGGIMAVFRYLTASATQKLLIARPYYA